MNQAGVTDAPLAVSAGQHEVSRAAALFRGPRWAPASRKLHRQRHRLYRFFEFCRGSLAAAQCEIAAICWPVEGNGGGGPPSSTTLCEGWM